MGDVTAEPCEQGVRRLSPLNDVMFACLFDDVGRTGSSMREFLSAMLESEGEEPIAEIISMQCVHSPRPDGVGQRLDRIDVKAKDTLGAVLYVEVWNTADGMGERDILHGLHLLSLDCSSRRFYDEGPRVRMFDICDARVRDQSTEIIEPVGLSFGKGTTEEATESFLIYHIQLPVFRERRDTLESVVGDPLLTWLYLLDRGYCDAKVTEQLARRSEGLRDFVERYDEAITDPAVMNRHDAFEDADLDRSGQLAFAGYAGAGR